MENETNNKLEIIIEDPRALYLMNKLLGYQETINEFAYQFGGSKIQLQKRLEELYPTMNIGTSGSEWLIDLLHTRLIKSHHITDSSKDSNGALEDDS